jgi:drug/metabolite transporter (DMT)-like permease
MLWVPIALLTAVSLATADTLSKRALRETEDMVIVWVREGYALPFLAIALLFAPMPSLDGRFWAALAVLVPLEVAALMLYVKAIRLSPLSLSVPYMALSPVFIVFISFISLGERPSAGGVAGILLIAAGAYLLNARASEGGALGPLRAIARERGSVLMIIVALIYAVTSTLGKVAINHSSPVFFGFFYPFTLTVALSAILLVRGKLRLVASRPRVFLPIGMTTAVMILSHFTALSLTQVAYMISVKRTSLIVSVIFGRLVFKEAGVGRRLVYSSIMAAGVALIALT